MKPYTDGMAEGAPDPVMVRIRELFERSQMTLDEVARRMGYSGATGRQSAWQFLNKTTDPRLSMVRKFAQAMGMPVDELLRDKKNGGPKKGRSGAL